jgi:valyl-tRNA synthetase
MDIRDQLNNVVDAFIKAEKINQIKSAIEDKQNHITDLPTKCGSCSFWMTSDCPKEKHTKVSNGMPICNSFKKAFWIDKTIQKLDSEISELQLSLFKIQIE